MLTTSTVNNYFNSMFQHQLSTLISSSSNVNNYTMHNKFSNFLCFASLCAHLCAISNNFNCNDEANETTSLHIGIWGEQELQEGSVS